MGGRPHPLPSFGHWKEQGQPPTPPLGRRGSVAPPRVGSERLAAGRPVHRGSGHLGAPFCVLRLLLRGPAGAEPGGRRRVFLPSILSLFSQLRAGFPS